MKLTRKTPILLFFALFAACTTSAPASAPSVTDEAMATALDNRLTELHERGEFNGTVLLAQDGRILFSKSYGFSDPQHKTRLHQNSSFNIASITKQFTAFAIMMLADQGLLGYDDPISRYLPEWQYDGVTIRHMLNHTSGLPDYLALAETGWDSSTLLTNEVTLSLLQDRAPDLDFPPGSAFEYSNTAYVALAIIVERVAGVPFDEFLRSNIFKPLKMDQTTTFNLLTDEGALQHRVLGMDGDRLNDLTNLDAVLGDGGLYSTARDLFKWDQALYSSDLLPQASIQQAFVSGKLADGAPIGYGFGWFIEDNNVVNHTGWWIGFDAFIRRDLANRSLLIVMDNASHHATINEVYDELTNTLNTWVSADAGKN